MAAPLVNTLLAAIEAVAYNPTVNLNTLSDQLVTALALPANALIFYYDPVQEDLGVKLAYAKTVTVCCCRPR
jgi:hypothetical protein